MSLFIRWLPGLSCHYENGHPSPVDTFLQLLCGELCFNYRSVSDVTTVASAAIHPAPPHSPHTRVLKHTPAPAALHTYLNLTP